jgi:N-acetylmuramic acid 6-phosphate etherase
MARAALTDIKRLRTEQSNPNSARLDKLSTRGMLQVINREDAKIPAIVGRCIPQIAAAVDEISARLKKGGRLFYVGAGTSGRLGCTDASEMPPTYGVPHTMVQGIMAGGPEALMRSKEGAEDDGAAGRSDLRSRRVNKGDAVVGLSASGRARYVREALQEAKRLGAFTACITCNKNSLLIPCAKVAIVADTGPEVVTGSTRMKAGTAQKLILNMLSTATMVRLGRVEGNRMVDLQIKCEKLQDRAQILVSEITGVSLDEAEAVLRMQGGSVRSAVAAINQPRQTQRKLSTKKRGKR